MSRRAPISAERMLEVLRDDLYAAPSFALFSNVRRDVGADVPNLRIADAVVVDTRRGPGLRLCALECKRTQSDLAAELADPRKAEAIARFCVTFEMVVPAPAKALLGSKLQLPRSWGVIEVDGRRATRLVHPVERRPEPAPEGFLKALLRSAAGQVEREQLGAGDAPLRAIGGQIDRGFVWLEGCLHRQAAPLGKHWPVRVPCWSCAEGLPHHPDAVDAALEAADPTSLERHRARVDALLGVRAPSGPALVWRILSSHGEATSAAAALVRMGEAVDALAAIGGAR